MRIGKLLLTAGLLLFALGFTGCDDSDDDYDLYQSLVGRTWVGDLGFYPLQSHIHFSYDGYGTDARYDPGSGEYLGHFDVYWETEYNDTIYIDYGPQELPRELYYAYVDGGLLRGDLYIGGNFYGTVTLYAY